MYYSRIVARTCAFTAAKWICLARKSNFFIEISSWISLALLYSWLSMPRSCVRTSDSMVSCLGKCELNIELVCLLVVSHIVAFCGQDSISGLNSHLQLLDLQLNLDGLAFQRLDGWSHLNRSVPFHDQFIAQRNGALVLQIANDADRAISLKSG